MNIPATVVCWLRQGASVRNGQVAFGGLSVLQEQPVAPALHLMGMDHERLTFRYSRRDYRLTDVHGTVAREIIA